jgi:hypothetical protein
MVGGAGNLENLGGALLMPILLFGR